MKVIQREKLLFQEFPFTETFQFNSSFKSLVVIERDYSLYHKGFQKKSKTTEREIVCYTTSQTLASLPLIDAGVCHFA
jgi:hypothetical protein